MSTKDRNQKSDEAKGVEEETPKSVSRRALLRGAVTAMPVVLTLQSGAALARSSNMISTSHYATTDRHGRTLCLDTESVYPVDGSTHLYDLGDPADAHVFAINDREYKVSPDSDAADMTAQEICESGRPGYYEGDYVWTDDDDEEDDDGYRRSWEQVQVRRGVLVSATALSSFAGSVRVTDL